MALAPAVHGNATFGVIEQETGDGVVVALGVPLFRGPLVIVRDFRAWPWH